MTGKNILFICGSLNQTTINYKIAQHLQDHHCFYTPYYSDGYIKWMVDRGFLDFTILGGRAKQRTLGFLEENRLMIDDRGEAHEYDLVVTCSDLIIPRNILNKNIILVQEGMTDPEDIRYYLTRTLGLPRYAANTAMTGLSHAYQKFCIASEGYREVFMQKGVRQERLVVTGIPNFDNVRKYCDNDFPHKGYVLAATSHMRETWKYENRKAFIRKAVRIAEEHHKPLIFKLHPNENFGRGVREVERYAPGARVFTSGNTDHMIANCDIMITRYSSVVLVASALGKKIYSDLDPEYLKKITPMQTGGTSAKKIADVCREYL